MNTGVGPRASDLGLRTSGFGRQTLDFRPRTSALEVGPLTVDREDSDSESLQSEVRGLTPDG